MIECGNNNNSEVALEFMRSISFVSKDNCRAIQMADLLAFYSRRDGVRQLNARQAGKERVEVDTMDKIIVENLPHRSFVATDFGEDASGSRFFAGDFR